MGASGWDYHVPYDGDVEAAFERLQDEVFASGDYLWEQEGPRPATRAELWSIESVRHSGTHSVLDMFEIGVGRPADFEYTGKVFAVTDAESERLFSTARPTAADLAGVDVGDLDGVPGTARYLVLYADGVPDQLYFFGMSGD